MKELFEVAAGSITGRNHQRIGQNNQDAYYGICSDRAAIAVVCDGCGSGAHSEVGAKIGARLVVEALAKAIATDLVETQFLPSLPAEFWEQVRQDVLAHLQSLALAMEGKDGMSRVSTNLVHDYFLFTIVGTIMTPAGATFFSIGDGAIVINGKLNRLGPFSGNAPPYLAYELLEPSSERWRFQLHPQVPLDEIKSILIGTDGVNDLINVAECYLPGKQEPVGAIAQFWEDDKYFKNPDMVRRKLSLINREVPKPDWHNQQILKEVGLLPDDTTLIAIRKR